MQINSQKIHITTQKKALPNLLDMMKAIQLSQGELKSEQSLVDIIINMTSIDTKQILKLLGTILIGAMMNTP